MVAPCLVNPSIRPSSRPSGRPSAWPDENRSPSLAIPCKPSRSQTDCASSSPLGNSPCPAVSPVREATSGSLAVGWGSAAASWSLSPTRCPDLQRRLGAQIAARQCGFQPIGCSSGVGKESPSNEATSSLLVELTPTTQYVMSCSALSVPPQEANGLTSGDASDDATHRLSSGDAEDDESLMGHVARVAVGAHDRMEAQAAAAEVARARAASERLLLETESREAAKAEEALIEVELEEQAKEAFEAMVIAAPLESHQWCASRRVQVASCEHAERLERAAWVARDLRAAMKMLSLARQERAGLCHMKAPLPSQPTQRLDQLVQTLRDKTAHNRVFVSKGEQSPWTRWLTSVHALLGCDGALG